MEELLTILNGIKPEIDFLHEQSLISDEILESMDIIMIVSELEQNYDITIDLETLVPENFENADAILKMVEQLRNE